MQILESIEKFLNKICDIHQSILGYPLNKNVFTAYMWIFFIGMCMAIISGGR
ncbi:hypothetical protein [Paenibacillus agilis]|uniref:hypothetical protein n=1 Tax=Paenibacillus agilis TaxID=3020863 RepID=UPI0016499459|nr:hypothetical protein [Paenibacillus agilis]